MLSHVPGRDLRTSIDLRLQYPAYFELKKAVEDSGADSASLVMLDVVTGEVLTMVNQPKCNPNDASDRQDLSRFRNRAIIDPIELAGRTASYLTREVISTSRISRGAHRVTRAVGRMPC